jgi:hypothetical protein
MPRISIILICITQIILIVIKIKSIIQFIMVTPIV